MCGFLPQLLPLLPTGPAGSLDRVLYEVLLTYREYVDPGDAAATAMDFVRHGSAHRAGGAFEGRCILYYDRFLLTFGLPSYVAAYLAYKSPSLFAALLLALFAAYWWCAVRHAAAAARAPATLLLAAGSRLLRAAVQAVRLDARAALIAAGPALFVFALFMDTFFCEGGLNRQRGRGERRCRA